MKVITISAKAKSGKDFATIIYDHVSEDVENIVAEVFTDGMKIQTILCDESDTSITIQPLAKGNYTYTITQIAGGTVSKSEGEFSIVRDNENDELFRAMMDKLEEFGKQIKKLYDKVDKLAKKTGSDNTEVENQKKYVENATKLQILNAKLNACESEIVALQNEQLHEDIDGPSLGQMKKDLEGLFRAERP